VVVRCPRCQTAYRLDALRVPESGVRVRCPRCAHVFRLASESAPASVAGPAPAPQPDALGGIERDLRQPPRLRPAPALRNGATSAPNAASRPPLPAWQPESERTLELGTPAAKGPPPRLETAPFRPDAAPAPPPEAAVHAATSTVAPAAPLAGTFPTPAAPGPAHERARRLARVLVSDILVYNQALRDQARSEGRLASALGPEIGKAWELYKSKVSPEVVANTTYFKDALNEILAGGEKIF